MKLSRGSRLVRFAYFGSYRAPDRTTLCGLFWNLSGRAVLVVITCTLLFRVLLFALSNLFAVSLVLAWITMLALEISWVEHWRKRREEMFDQEAYLREWREKRERRSVLREALWGIKNRVCPVIEIEGSRCGEAK